MIALFRRFRTLTYYVCYNQVSYVVACEHALSVDPSSARLLIDSARVWTQPRYAKSLVHRELDNWQVMRACLLSLLRPVALYVPHLRFGLMLRALCRLAGSLGLVDDGLDTLREKPKNIDVGLLGDFTELLTFEDYESLATWTCGLRDRRVCALSRLLEDVRPALASKGARALVVQSPGVRPSSAALELRVAPHEVLMLLHSNPNKRGDVPSEYASRSARDCSIEKTVLGFDGPVLTGETMVTVVALYLRLGADLLVELTAEQYANLKSLHGRLSTAGVRLLLDRGQ